MASAIEDYALIGDCQSAALVARDGSIDWLCLPRFDSDACFAALLGTPENGRFRIAPRGVVREVRRRYRQDTLVLETEFHTEDGVVQVIDFMPPRSESPDLVRIVVGKRGTVEMQLELVMRFGYGASVPWVRRVEDGILAVAGPEALHLRTAVPLRGENRRTSAEFTVREHQRVAFVLTWHDSRHPPDDALDPEAGLKATEAFWVDWVSQCRTVGEHRDAVVRSLITLKALTYAPTGGIVAAPTTSLPTRIGGVRNWDYRYCWLRDATFTLYALLGAGFEQEARDFREWLLRAVAGSPEQLQIMYGLGGERRLNEIEIEWLPGYQGSRPVRVGNGAFRQEQLDVYGEVLDMLHGARLAGLDPSADAWALQRVLVDHVSEVWHEPDRGIWEVRGEPRHFTSSKVMTWVAMDRAVKAVERFGLPGPVERWRRVRDAIHADVCRHGVDGRGVFTQAYGSSVLDASVLLLPQVGFLSPQDARVRATAEAIERELCVDGFVQRYQTQDEVDGLPDGEGTFLLCSFWLADNWLLLGRRADAERMFAKLLALRNDVGLLSEQYDPRAGRMLGNFPQAYSHVALINTAHNLADTEGSARPRRPS